MVVIFAPELEHFITAVFFLSLSLCTSGTHSVFMYQLGRIPNTHLHTTKPKISSTAQIYHNVDAFTFVNGNLLKY